MNEYVVEVTEVLKRQIRVICLEGMLAEISVRNMYENGEIILNQNDCVSSSVKLLTVEEDNQPGLFDDI